MGKTTKWTPMKNKACRIQVVALAIGVPMGSKSCTPCSQSLWGLGLKVQPPLRCLLHSSLRAAIRNQQKGSTQPPWRRSNSLLPRNHPRRFLPCSRQVPRHQIYSSLPPAPTALSTPNIRAVPLLIQPPSLLHFHWRGPVPKSPPSKVSCCDLGTAWS